MRLWIFNIEVTKNGPWNGQRSFFCAPPAKAGDAKTAGFGTRTPTIKKQCFLIVGVPRRAEETAPTALRSCFLLQICENIFIQNQKSKRRGKYNLPRRLGFDFCVFVRRGEHIAQQPELVLKALKVFNILLAYQPNTGFLQQLLRVFGIVHSKYHAGFIVRPCNKGVKIFHINAGRSQ